MFIFYHEFDSASSGAAIVILNLIKGLLSEKEKVLLIAKKEGALHSILKEKEIGNLIVIDNDSSSIKDNMYMISNNDTIVTTHYYSVFRLFKNANPKIIFYSVNTTSLHVANLYFGKINVKYFTRKLINRIENNGGLVFVDEFAKEENEKSLGIVISKPVYLPIPVEVPSSNIWRSGDYSDRLFSFTYVGRAVDWKIFPVRKILKDINRFGKLSQKLTFHIITDDAKVFQKEILDIDTKEVAVKFHENLSPAQLNDFLVNNSSLHFAMGTSALDGAKLGIPTVLVDFSFDEFPEKYRYNFLFSTRKYSVGGRIISGQVFNGYAMEDLFELSEKKEVLEEFSEKSYQHVRSYHQLAGVTNLLLKYSESCNIHLKDVSKYLIRYWY